MPQSRAISTLVDLAKKKSDEIGLRLAAALRENANSAERLGVLDGYRNDYTDQLTRAMAAGISPQTHQNFLRFIERLDVALTTQSADLKVRELEVTTLRAELVESERRRLAFATIVSRASKVYADKQSRRDQKLTDEHAARAAGKSDAKW